jgi:putative ABC transport system ATP-binding protein
MTEHFDMIRLIPSVFVLSIVLPKEGFFYAPAGTTDIVRLEDVYKSYTTGKVVTEVLKGASLDVEENSFIVVFGPSGSGKTTLLNLIGALDKATSGQVWVDGRNLSEADSSSLEAFRRERLGFIFQFFNLLSNLTALENVELGLEIMGMRGPEVRERAMHYLEKVGLQDKADKFPNELAGGEQQRVAIARALAKDPSSFWPTSRPETWTRPIP